MNASDGLHPIRVARMAQACTAAGQFEPATESVAA
jgi:hypothetical protein